MDEDVRILLPHDVLDRKADGRGRITLGSGYAGKQVTVAIVQEEGDA